MSRLPEMQPSWSSSAPTLALSPAFDDEMAAKIEEFSEPHAVSADGVLFREGDAPDRLYFLKEGEATIALELQAQGKRVVYAPACAKVTPALRERLSGADALFFDGTTFTDGELLSQGLMQKTARRMGHMSMSGPEGSIAALADLPIGRKIFIHINNSNPVLLDDSPERKLAEAAGWEIACDGMEVRL